MTIYQSKQKLVATCESHLGYREGQNNWNKYAENKDLQRWYGWRPQNQPWCDSWGDSMFLEAFGLENAAKMTYQPIGQGSALCRTSAQCYKNHNAWYHSPEVGDEIFFFYSGDINHVGIVVGVSGGIVHTIEGNTSDIGMVARRSYAIGNTVIAGYGRPDWSVVSDDKDTTQPVTPPVVTPVSPSVALNCTIKLPMLRKGDGLRERSAYKPWVKAMQELLIANGCGVGADGADGEFGNNTFLAVVKFQEDRGLDADGIVGALTWAALAEVK